MMENRKEKTQHTQSALLIFFPPFFPFFVRIGLMKDDQTDSLAGSRPTNFASDIEVLSDLDFFLFRVEGAEG